MAAASGTERVLCVHAAARPHRYALPCAASACAAFPESYCLNHCLHPYPRHAAAPSHLSPQRPLGRCPVARFRRSRLLCCRAPESAQRPSSPGVQPCAGVYAAPHMFSRVELHCVIAGHVSWLFMVVSVALFCALGLGALLACPGQSWVGWLTGCAASGHPNPLHQQQQRRPAHYKQRPTQERAYAWHLPRGRAPQESGRLSWQEQTEPAVESQGDQTCVARDRTPQAS